jgi:medium-chain acyl-[acyl-carrier-protein] hydrolase
VTWANALRDLPLEVCAIQPPGRENRLGDAPFTRLPPLVAALAAAIEPLLDRPHWFFGHSMGTLIAFELARTLRARGQRLPLALFVSGAHPPHVPRDHEPLAHLDDRAFIEQVAERYEGIPPAVLEHAELLSIVLPTLRADISLLEAYEYEPDTPLTCPIHAFAGRDDIHVDEPRLQKWSELTSGACSATFFPGGHFYLQPQRQALLDALRAHL